MQKYEWVAGTGNDIVHTKAVDNFGVMLPGFGHDDLLCFPLAGADSNSEALQAARSLTGVGIAEFQIATEFLESCHEMLSFPADYRTCGHAFNQSAVRFGMRFETELRTLC